MAFFIRPAVEAEWEDAMALAWRVFSEFEAPSYGEQGTKSFLDFISGNTLKNVFLHGKYPVFLAIDEESGRIIGVISLREHNHISLLFVDSAYQKNGVGTALIKRAGEYVRTDNEEARHDRNKPEEYRYFRAKGGILTVNAAPSAVGFYKKNGFVVTGDEKENDGIKYIPMFKKGKLFRLK